MGAERTAAKSESAKKLLTSALGPLQEELDKAGGRGVELANEIDRITFAIQALDGELGCPHCDAVLTSPPE